MAVNTFKSKNPALVSHYIINPLLVKDEIYNLSCNYGLNFRKEKLRTNIKIKKITSFY